MKKFLEACVGIVLILVVVSFLLKEGESFEGLEGLDAVNYEIQDSVSFDSGHATLSGDGDKSAFDLKAEIVNLNIEAGGCSFRMEQSEDEAVYLEFTNVGKIQAYVEGGTLYIKTTTGEKAWNKMSSSKVVLYVPEGMRFTEAEINLGAGTLNCPGLKAAKASLEVGAGQLVAENAEVQSMQISVGAGQVRLTDMKITELNAEVEMGELVAEGAVAGNADVECSMGNIELRLAGAQKDFNYELSGAIGNMTLGDEDISGFTQSRDIDNGAEKKMEIDCSMGNVLVKFEE